MVITEFTPTGTGEKIVRTVPLEFGYIYVCWDGEGFITLRPDMTLNTSTSFAKELMRLMYLGEVSTLRTVLQEIKKLPLGWQKEVLRLVEAHIRELPANMIFYGRNVIFTLKNSILLRDLENAHQPAKDQKSVKQETKEYIEKNEYLNF